LASREIDVLVFDNLATGSLDWLEGDLGILVREGTVANFADVHSAFSEFRPTHVIHAAASYDDPDDWAGDLENNAQGTLNVVRASEEFGVSAFIYLQTALGYGVPSVSPIPITHGLNPTSSYGISKVAGEMYALAAKLPISVSLRLANVCAPRLSIGPLPTFYKKILSDEECTVSEAERDFLSFFDFVELIELVLRHDAAVSGPFNVSSGSGTSIQSVFGQVSEALGAANVQAHVVPVASDDIRSVVLDPATTAETFGWSAKVALSEVISQQILWFEEYGVGTIRSHLRQGGGDD
jgi:nucleoside-diphosphate-sugar epimerase